MQPTNETSIASLIISIFSFFVSSVSFFITFYYNRKNWNKQRLDLIINLHNDYLADTEVVDFYYKYIDRGMLDENTIIINQPIEKTIDRLLAKLNNISRIYYEGTFELQDIYFIANEIITLYENEGIQNYLKWLGVWCKDKNISGHIFDSFIKLGKELTSLDKKNVKQNL